MPTKVLMPQLGESVDEATITKWLKNVGDKVEEYEALIEVNTDKVDTEIPSPAGGVVLATLIAEGTTVQVGTLLAWIGQPGESLPGAGAPQIKPSAAPTPAPVTAQPTALSTLAADYAQPAPAAPARELGFISPVVARMAAEYNLDLNQIPGTGLGGRITKQDVLAYLEKKPAGAPKPAPTVAPVAVPISTAPAPGAPALPTLPGESTLIPHTAIRRAIAEHMVFSERTSPHVTTVMEVDLSSVVAHRYANKDAFARDGVNLTFTAYFIAAIVAGLKAYPQVNSSWSDEGLLVHKHINIGMATSLGDEGLIVPVIKHADGLSLLGLARTINDLANRARAKKLQPDEVKGGTFTITNHGISGSLFAAPIINQPQAGILGVGAIQKRAVVITDKTLGDVIAIRPMVYLSFTFDHRILDGASADYFLAKVVQSLQNYNKESA
jgi:2-oxoglutarate dehydrogenase E2 component (dihydrolipoamide succinyltransferase)